MKSIGNLIIESIIFFDVNKIDRVELSEIFVEFNLFEDIYSDSISGNLLLIDVDNLLIVEAAITPTLMFMSAVLLIYQMRFRF